MKKLILILSFIIVALSGYSQYQVKYLGYPVPVDSIRTNTQRSNYIELGVETPISSWSDLSLQISQIIGLQTALDSKTNNADTLTWNATKHDLLSVTVDTSYIYQAIAAKQDTIPVDTALSTNNESLYINVYKNPIPGQANDAVDRLEVKKGTFSTDSSLYANNSDSLGGLPASAYLTSGGTIDTSYIYAAIAAKQDTTVTDTSLSTRYDSLYIKVCNETLDTCEYLLVIRDNVLGTSDSVSFAEKSGDSDSLGGVVASEYVLNETGVNTLNNIALWAGNSSIKSVPRLKWDTSYNMLVVGNSGTAAPGRCFVANKNYDATQSALYSNGGHAFSDDNYITMQCSGGYTSYDARATFSGSNYMNHHAGYQVRTTYGSSAAIDRLTGFQCFITQNGGTCTQATGLQVRDFLGTGAISYNYGIQVEAMDRGTNNAQIKLGGVYNNPSTVTDQDMTLILLGVTGSPAFGWDESEDEFTLSKGIDVTGTITAADINVTDSINTTDSLDIIVDNNLLVRLKDGIFKVFGRITAKHFQVEYITDTYASSKTVDMSTGQKHKMTVSGDMTINFTNIVEGVVYTFHFYQDGTGGHAITLGTWNGGSAYPLENTGAFDTDASDMTKLQFEYDGTNIIYGITNSNL